MSARSPSWPYLDEVPAKLAEFAADGSVRKLPEKALFGRTA